jgi:uncharacterized protein YoxC
VSNESIVTIITGVIETGAVSFFILMIIRGLGNQIESLKQTIDIQNKTIEAMDKRLFETEKILDLYKQFADEYPKAFDAYKTNILKTKDDIILNLEQKVVRQNNDIKDLEDKISKLNPEEQKSFQRITNFLLDEKNKTFHDFVQKFEKQTDSIIYTIIKSANFEEFVKQNEYNIIIDENITEIFLSTEKTILEKRIRNISMGIRGIMYAFTFGRDLYLNISCKKILEQYYKACKE